MTTAAPDRQQEVPEIGILAVVAGLGIVVGIFLIVAGVANGNGSYFDGPDLADLATKVTCISIGSSLATIGFLCGLAAMILSGMRRIIQTSQTAAQR